MRLTFFSVTLLLPIFCFAEQTNNSDTTRIVNGFDAPASEFGFMAAIEFDGKYRCGGYVASEEYIITAAHCVTIKDGENTLVSADFLKVYLGNHSRIEMKKNIQFRYDVSEIIIHPNYNFNNGFQNDIALIKLKRKIINVKKAPSYRLSDPSYFDNRLSTQRLSDSGLVSSYDFLINADLIGLGWGLDENNELSNNLKQNFMATVNNELCKGKNTNYSAYFCSQSYRGHNKTDTCSGDSGGPVIWKEPNGKHYVVGIVSSGSRECDATKSYYMKISSFHDFLSQYISDNDPLEFENLHNAFQTSPHFYEEESEGILNNGKISFYNGSWAKVTGVLQYNLNNKIFTTRQNGTWYGYTNFNIPKGAKEVIFSLYYGKAFFRRQYSVIDLNNRHTFGVSAYGTISNTWAKEDF